MALDNFTDNILDKMNGEFLTGALFLDLSKVFNAIDNSLLIKKLKSIYCIQHYLAYSTQRTIVILEIFQHLCILVGISQGSILRPLLVYLCI